MNITCFWNRCDGIICDYLISTQSKRSKLMLIFLAQKHVTCMYVSSGKSVNAFRLMYSFEPFFHFWCAFNHPELKIPEAKILYCLLFTFVSGIEKFVYNVKSGTKHYVCDREMCIKSHWYGQTTCKQFCCRNSVKNGL